MDSQQFIKELALFDKNCATAQCDGCPFYINGNCSEAEIITSDTVAYEKIIHSYYNTHKPKTRREKVQELFPDNVILLSCSNLGVNCPNDAQCPECEYRDWWDQPYEEQTESPKD